MSEATSRGIANLATKRRPDPKRLLAKNRQDDETPVEDEPVVLDVPAPPAAAAEAPATEAVDAPPAASARAGSKRSTRSATPPEGDDAGYLALERKETRLREGQLGELTAHARRLNKAKTAPAPRITENTLIRVAIDLLLSRSDGLRGNTEADLRRSLGL